MGNTDLIRGSEESRIRRRKRSAAFLAATAKLDELATKHFVPFLNGRKNPGPHAEALALIYYRTCAWLKTLAMLDNVVHLQAIAMGTRCVLDMSVDLKLLADDASRVDDFRAFLKIDRYRAAAGHVRLLEQDPRVEPRALHVEQKFVEDPRNRREFDALAEKHWGRDGRNEAKLPDHWLGGSPAARAKKAGRKYGDMRRLADEHLGWHERGGFIGSSGIAVHVLRAMFCVAHMILHRCFVESTTIVGETCGLFGSAPALRDALRDAGRTKDIFVFTRKLDEVEKRVLALWSSK
ncbi:MAG: hypothetical protein ACYTAF_11140 [Planctomycetota bacterium]|jgi:hypothetical protein